MLWPAVLLFWESKIQEERKKETEHKDKKKIGNTSLNQTCTLYQAPENVPCLMFTQAVVFNSFQSLSKTDYYDRHSESFPIRHIDRCSLSSYSVFFHSNFILSAPEPLKHFKHIKL